MMRKKVTGLILIVLLVQSCGGPEALVINRVNSDGSIDREVILTYHKDEFDLEECQVPVDSTWDITKVMDVSQKGDTTWTLTARRHFASAADITEEYRSFGGSNERLNRSASFIKSFRWFTTHYTFSETVEEAMGGYTPEEWFSAEQLYLFYMPDGMVDDLTSGSDSIYYRARIDSLDKEQEKWWLASLTSVFIDEVIRLGREMGAKPDTAFLSGKRDLLRDFVFNLEDEKSFIDTVFGMEFYKTNQILVDSAMAVSEERFNIALESDDYSIQIVMPGTLVGTNGYPDAENGILWKVNGECFLAGDYVMWAESGETNWWAVIVSAAFVLFVFLGFILRIKKKARA
ncbi:MAG: hypothetical protein LC649_01260 [Bacteroidales bacterium]|nr:hypothetical protein [Bacteroidales bacterium]